MDISRVSACTFPLREQPLEEALPIIAAAGFKRIDLLGRMPHFSTDAMECDPAAVKAMVKAHGLEIANLGTYVGVGFASDDEAVQKSTLKEIWRTIDVAHSLGAKSVRVFRPNSEIDDPTRIDHIVPWLKHAADYALGQNVRMGFENHGGPLCGNPDHCKTLCDKVGSAYFGVLYDPCNLMGAGEDYRSALETMKDHIAHVHFKDGAITDDGFKRTMLGEGDIDFGWIMKRLDEIGYKGDIALEYELPEPSADIGLTAWYDAYKAM